MRIYDGYDKSSQMALIFDVKKEGGLLIEMLISIRKNFSEEGQLAINEAIYITNLRLERKDYLQ